MNNDNLIALLTIGLFAVAIANAITNKETLEVTKENQEILKKED